MRGIDLKKIEASYVHKNQKRVLKFLELDVDTLNISYNDLNHDGRDEMIISGYNFGPQINKYIFSKINDSWYLIPREDNAVRNYTHPVFQGDRVIIEPLDGGKIYEVITEVFIRYANAPDELWRDYYTLDQDMFHQEKMMYLYLKREKYILMQRLPRHDG